MDEMKMRGRSRVGERNVNAVLTEAAVREIRLLRAAGGSLKTIAAHFGVEKSTVCGIARRVSWAHVQ